MVWARLDDAILDNPKIAGVGVLGFALHIAAITYCARNVLVNKRDGFIPRAKVAGLLPFGDVFAEAVACLPVPNAVQDKIVDSLAGESDPIPSNVVAKLVEAGLWDEVEGGYVLHDYLDYNPGRDEVLRAKAERSEAGKRGAAKRWTDGKSHSSSHAPAMANANQSPKQSDGKPIAKWCPDPDPDPDPKKRGESARARAPSVVASLTGESPEEIAPATNTTLATFDIAALESGVSVATGAPCHFDRHYREIARWAEIFSRCEPAEDVDRGAFLRGEGARWGAWCKAKGMAPSRLKFSDWLNAGAPDAESLQQRRTAGGRS